MVRAAYWDGLAGLGMSAAQRLAPDADLTPVASPTEALDLVADGQVGAAVVLLEDARRGLHRAVVDHLLFEVAGLLAVDSHELGDDPPTRWIRVERDSGATDVPAARTLLFVVPAADRPGTLTAVLAAFTSRGINLSRTSARPLGELGMFGFLLEIDDDLDQPHVRAALGDVFAAAQSVKVLGRLPATPGSFGVVGGRALTTPYATSLEELGSDRDTDRGVAPTNSPASPTRQRDIGVVGIVGLGLIGGSLAKDLLAAGIVVLGSDPDPRTRRLAAEAGIEMMDPDELAHRADLAVVATPLSMVGGLVRDLLAASPSLVVTDVASVKTEVAAAFSNEPRVVPGHPMAGTERSGFEAARSGLLAGAPWLLTPTRATAVTAVAQVIDVVQKVGARPSVVTPHMHDAIVASVSHAPHLFAFALQSLTGRVDADLAAVAGPSFRDATRVAASDPTFWADLIGRNREAVTATLDEMMTWIEATLAADEDGRRQRLAAARRDPGGVHPARIEQFALGPDGAGLDELAAAGAQGRVVESTHLDGDVLFVTVVG